MNTTFERGDGKEEWLTPRHIIEAFPQFDLDPCASVIRPWPTAKRHYTIQDNGLTKPWDGFCYVNPPYGGETKKWFRKLFEHSGGGIALTFARTETEMFFDSVWGKATAILFLKGRLSFCNTAGKAIGTAGAASVLIAYGDEGRGRLFECNLAGCFIDLHYAEKRAVTKRDVAAKTGELFTSPIS